MLRNLETKTPIVLLQSGNTFTGGDPVADGTYLCQTPIVSLQSGNSLYLGKPSNYHKVSNNLTALFYGTLQKSL